MTVGAGPSTGSVRGREAGGWCARPAAGAATFPGDVPESAEASQNLADLLHARDLLAILPWLVGRPGSRHAVRLKAWLPYLRSVRCRSLLARRAAALATLRPKAEAQRPTGATYHCTPV